MFCQNHNYVVTNAWSETNVKISYKNPTNHLTTQTTLANSISLLSIKYGRNRLTMLKPLFFLLAAAWVDPGRSALQSAEQWCKGRYGRIHQVGKLSFYEKNVQKAVETTHKTKRG